MDIDGISMHFLCQLLYLMHQFMQFDVQWHRLMSQNHLIFLRFKYFKNLPWSENSQWLKFTKSLIFTKDLTFTKNRRPRSGRP